MKVIDLLNKIANGEEVPKKIKYKNAIYTLRDDKDDYTSGSNWFTDSYDYLELNDEVEIIEEDKKIRKITLLDKEIKLGSVSNWLKDSTNNEEKIAICIECNAMKINEIIDYINGGTNGE